MNNENPNQTINLLHSYMRMSFPSKVLFRCKHPKFPSKINKTNEIVDHPLLQGKLLSRPHILCFSASLCPEYLSLSARIFPSKKISSFKLNYPPLKLKESLSPVWLVCPSSSRKSSPPFLYSFCSSACSPLSQKIPPKKSLCSSSQNISQQTRLKTHLHLC